MRHAGPIGLGAKWRDFRRCGISPRGWVAWCVAGTNVNLQELVDAKRFRADLFYRLNVFPIQIPALRERPEDIQVLVRHFAHQYAGRIHRTIKLIPSATMDALVRYSWPGNIRELQNLIERAVILSSGEMLQVPLSEIHDALNKSAAHQPLETPQPSHILAPLNKT